MARTLIPNSTQIPDVILDRWMPLLTGAELAVVMLIARKTFGWGKKFDRIGTKQLMDGTGKDRTTVQATCDEMARLGVLRVQYPGDGHTSCAYQIDVDKVDEVVAKLEARKADKRGGKIPPVEKAYCAQEGRENPASGKIPPVSPGAGKSTTGGGKIPPVGAGKSRPQETKRNTKQETSEGSSEPSGCSSEHPEKTARGGQVAIALFAEMFKERFGENPDISAKAAGLLNTIFKRIGEEKYVRSLTGYFDGDHYLAQSNGYDAITFASKTADTWLSGLRQARSGRVRGSPATNRATGETLEAAAARNLAMIESWNPEQ